MIASHTLVVSSSAAVIASLSMATCVYSGAASYHCAVAGIAVHFFDRDGTKIIIRGVTSIESLRSALSVYRLVEQDSWLVYMDKFAPTALFEDEDWQHFYSLKRHWVTLKGE